MSYVQLIKLAEYYNTSIDYLLYVTDERKPYPKSIVKQSKIANKIREYLKKNVISLRKTQLNIIPEILFGMISVESVITNDIA